MCHARPFPLDRIYPTAWDPDWTTEAIDLLTVLTRLTDIAPAQAELLAGVMTAEKLSWDALGLAGARWPLSPQDRKPRYSYTSLRRTESAEQGTLI